MRCWCDYLSGSMCRLFAYGPADATASHPPIISCLIYIQPFWYRLTQVVLEKRPLNGCSCSSSITGANCHELGGLVKCWCLKFKKKLFCPTLIWTFAGLIFTQFAVMVEVRLRRQPVLWAKLAVSPHI